MVSVDTVYKTVLLILNKEQRGYMTPFEFNNIATQVQREIFEAYFEELNQQLRVPQNDSEYANRVKNLNEKIDVFKTFNTCTGSNPFTLPQNSITAATIATPGTGYSTSGIPQATTIVGTGTGTDCTVDIVVAAGPGPITSFTIADGGKGYKIGDQLTIAGGGGNAVITVTSVDPTVHRLGTLIYNVNEKEIQPVQRNEYFLLNKSPLTKPTAEYPVYILEGSGVPSAPPSNVTVFPNTITTNQVDVYYIKAPEDVVWAYTTGGLQQFLYAPPGTIGTTPISGSVDFELHNSEQTQLVIKILFYAGVVIRDPQIVNVAAQKIQQEEMLEKQ